MNLPETGDRIRSGCYATVTHILPPDEYGNVCCVVEDDQDRLGWIIYYPDDSRSNVNRYRTKRAAEIRARLENCGRLPEGNGEKA